MSYQARLMGELRKHPNLVNLAEAALNEARHHASLSAANKPPHCPLADKVLAAMEEERKGYGSIVSLRLDGAGWSAHIYDPELEGMSSAGCEDPEKAWEAVQARRVEKQSMLEKERA